MVHGQVTGSGCVEDDLDDVFARLTVLVAGSVGELVHQGETIGLRGSDKRMARFCAELLCSNENAARKLIKVAQLEAEAVIRENEYAFNVLVDRLLADRTMTGEAVMALLEKHNVPYRSRRSAPRS